MEIDRKSMLDINVSIGGLLIGQGGGENDFVTVTSPQRFSSKTGVHGDVVFFETPNSIYEVTIACLETSEVNEDLQALYNAQISNAVQGLYVMQIEDTGTNEEMSGKGLIVKEPDRSKTAEAQNYEWMIHLAIPGATQYNPRGIVIS